MHFFLRRGLFVLFFCSLAVVVAFASINGSISGVVQDPGGSVIAGAAVTVTETQTGVKSQTVTDSKGFYNFPDLPIGKYDLEIQSGGFKTFRQTGVVVDANSALRVDATLQIGSKNDSVVVNSDAVHVETESTQNGEVIEGKKILAVPLNGRSYTDLLFASARRRSLRLQGASARYEQPQSFWRPQRWQSICERPTRKRKRLSGQRR